jgi:hypothetical protein
MNRSPGVFSLLVHVVLKVTRQAFDLLDLLTQIASEACKLLNYIVFDRLGLVALGYRFLVVVS